MDWKHEIHRTLDYIEEHLTETIAYDELARMVHVSSYHFQRVFSLTCGISLGEYIRRRRLSCAANDLLSKGINVTETAFLYGYDSVESFSRAFTRFHGVLPSKIKQSKSKTYSRLVINLGKTGGIEMQYKVEEKESMILTGYKKRFYGVPYGQERVRQEKEFAQSTRAKQWLLMGASCDYTKQYAIVTNIDDEGYDFYFAYELDAATREDLINPTITGVDFIDKLGFETLIIPRQKYVVFNTPKCKRPIADYANIRKNIVSEWLPETSYRFIEAPELVIFHWRPIGEWQKERYIEICLPIA